MREDEDEEIERIEEKERRQRVERSARSAKNAQISEKRRPRNREYTLVSCFFVLIFVSTDRISDLL